MQMITGAKTTIIAGVFTGVSVFLAKPWLIQLIIQLSVYIQRYFGIKDGKDMYLLVFYLAAAVGAIVLCGLYILFFRLLKLLLMKK